MEKMNFEKSIGRLEEITDLMEKGELPLDEMIKLYSEGTKLASKCSKALETARTAVKKLNDEDGENDD